MTDLEQVAASHGFTAVKSEPVSEVEGVVHLMRHAASGARLMFIENDDANKAFSITFKTPAADDTGVFHILEHSVLCGSEKFPVKEPFVNLLKTSMQTFLNAMTFPDKTMYPVASTNEQDLVNLMDVYLDAVFHPDIYRRPVIFQQEGWHRELEGEGEDARLVVNGVVYNEMKGALSEPDSGALRRTLGGVVPEYDLPLRVRRHAGSHPDAHLRGIPRGPSAPLPSRQRLHHPVRQPGCRPLPRLSGRAVPGSLGRERVRATGHQPPWAAGSRGPRAGGRAHGHRAGERLRRRGLRHWARRRARAHRGRRHFDGRHHGGQRVAPETGAARRRASPTMPSGTWPTPWPSPSPWCPCGAPGPVPPRSCRAIVEAEARRLVEGGLDRELVRAALSHAEFVMRERNFGYPDGVVLAMSAMAGWLYDDDDGRRPTCAFEDVFASLREKVEEGYFEALLRELFLDNDHRACAEVVPTESDEAAEEAEAAGEREAAAELTEDEAAFIREAVRALREAQEAPDAPEALEKLPQLSRADIGEAPAEAMWEVGECGPWRLIRHHLPCRGIAYAYRYFAMDGLAFDELPYATVLACVLGKLDTARHTAAELDTLVQAHLGNLGFAVEVHEDAEDRERIRPMFVMGSSALDEEVPWAARLAEEVLRETDFADTERIRDILGQRRIAMEQAFASAGHSAAMARVASYYLPAGVVREALSGVGFYRFLKELLAHFDERAGELTAKLADLAARLFTDGGCTLSFGGRRGGSGRLSGSLGAFRRHGGRPGAHGAGPLRTSTRPSSWRATSPTPPAAGDRRLLGEPYGGTWLLASRILSYDFLWTEVRVKGGAYGAGFQTTRSGSSRFYSYRDPRIDETVERFRTAGDWLAGVFSPTESEMDGYVVSTVASLDAPAKARELLRRQDGLYFSGATLASRARVREEVRAARTEDVRALAPSVGAIAGAGCVCAFGNGEVIRASGEDFNVVDLLA